MRTRIKICGCTSIADIEGAVEAGADAVGVIFAASPRKVTLANARALVRSVPSFVAVVGVMVNPDETFVDDVLALGMVPQFSGDETPEFCATWANGRYVKAIHFTSGVEYSAADAEAAAARYPDADLLFDSRAGALYGGTGTSFSWPLVEAIARRRRIIVSGGLVPGNVAAAVAGVRPFGVDVRSGVESGDKKDTEKCARSCARFVKPTRDIRLQKPDSRGYFGKFGGMFVPEVLVGAVTELEAAMDEAFATRRLGGISCGAARLRRAPLTDLSGRTARGSERGDDSLQTRRPQSHRRAQDQQHRRPGAARAAHGQDSASSRRRARANTAWRPRPIGAKLGIPVDVFMGAARRRTSSAQRVRDEVTRCDRALGRRAARSTLKDATNEAFREWAGARRRHVLHHRQRRRRAPLSVHGTRIAER